MAAAGWVPPPAGRAAGVLVAFRFGWLACCATVPEFHLRCEVPVMEDLRVVVGTDGRLSALAPRGPVATAPDARSWWLDVAAAFTPLTEALHQLGGPPPDSHQYWGNPVGLAATVLWRMQRAGMPGDLAGTARELTDATGRPELVHLDPRRFHTGQPTGQNSAGGSRPWVRRRTCCQWWRTGGGYCAECVVRDSPRERNHRS